MHFQKLSLLTVGAFEGPAKEIGFGSRGSISGARGGRGSLFRARGGGFGAKLAPGPKVSEDVYETKEGEIQKQQVERLVKKALCRVKWKKLLNENKLF